MGLRNDCIVVKMHSKGSYTQYFKVCPTRKDNFVLRRQDALLTGWFYNCWNVSFRLCFYSELLCFNSNGEQTQEKKVKKKRNLKCFKNKSMVRMLDRLQLCCDFMLDTKLQWTKQHILKDTFLLDLYFCLDLYCILFFWPFSNIVRVKVFLEHLWNILNA